MASARALARRFVIAYGDLPSELRSSAHLASLGGYDTPRQFCRQQKSPQGERG